MLSRNKKRLTACFIFSFVFSQNSFAMRENKNISYEEKALKALDLIKNSEKITLLPHWQPDNDAVCSCSALENVLLKMNKKIETIFPNYPGFKHRRRPKNISINKYTQKPDLLIALDTANYERLYFPKEFENIPLINIDHHVSNSLKGVYNFVEKDSSSACEVLFKLIKEWNIKDIDQYTAECLLYGILSDSCLFQTTNTHPSTLKITAELMELGADLFTLETQLISHKNPKIINVWGKFLSNIKITQNGKAAWAKITQEDLRKENLTLRSLIGFVNFLSQISGVEYTLLFYEMENGQTKVSLRSKKEDVNKIAKLFGGGGHKNASGILTNMPIDEIIEKITKLI
jgi:bifunctional oligoribonuclease and PAP phosphatase NrnA